MPPPTPQTTTTNKHTEKQQTNISGGRDADLIWLCSSQKKIHLGRANVCKRKTHYPDKLNKLM